MNLGFNGTNDVNAMTLRREYGRGIRKNLKREYSKIMNQMEYTRELNHIFLLYCSRFKWDLKALNIPDEYMEQRLFYNRFMCYYNDPTLGWILLPATPVGWNVYMQPTELLLQGYNYSKTIKYSVDADDAVLLYDNVSYNIPAIEFMRYAALISDVGRSCEVYSNALKKPLGFATDFSNKKTAESVIESISVNDSFILYDVEMFPKDDSGTPIVDVIKSDHNAQDLKGLDMYRQSLYDEMLGRLGIATTPVRKQAQQTEDEINKNDEMCKIILAQADDCRTKAVEKMIDISGKEISCEIVDNIGDDAWETNPNGVIKND